MDNLFAFRYRPAFRKHGIGNLVTMATRSAIKRYVFEDDAVEVEFGFGITLWAGERNIAKVHMVMRIGEPINQYLIDVFTPLANLWETYNVVGHSRSLSRLFNDKGWRTASNGDKIRLYRIDFDAGCGEAYVPVFAFDLDLIVTV